MPLSSQESDGDSNYVFVATIADVKHVIQLLKAIFMKDRATVFISSSGMKVTTEEFKSVQASAYIQAELFQNFSVQEDSVAFRIDLKALLECLNIFGSNNSSFTVTPALKMCYLGYGSPLTLLLHEDGVFTECSINTMEPDEILDFDFTPDRVINKMIMKSECLKDVFMELDMTSDVLQVYMSPDKPYFRLTTIGEMMTFHMECPKDSEVVEVFECNQAQTNRYKTSFMKPTTKAILLSDKVSFRTDERGILCLQFMIVFGSGVTTFIEYFCAPNEDSSTPEG